MVGTRRLIHKCFQGSGKDACVDVQMVGGVIYVRDVVPFVSVNEGSLGYVFERLCTNAGTTPASRLYSMSVCTPFSIPV